MICSKIKGGVTVTPGQIAHMLRNEKCNLVKLIVWVW